MMNMDYTGMTLNERLYHSSQMDEFDSAVAIGNCSAIRVILSKVSLSSDQIEKILMDLNLRGDKSEEE